MAKHDKKQFPDILTASEEGNAPYYTNSSNLPVGYTSDIFEALDIQDDLQTLYTSGTVFHAFLGEKLPSWKSAAALVKKIAENYKLPYYTLSPTYSVCGNHGYLPGEQKICPTCGKATETYSRITGYYRPVQNWNDGKTQEFKDRQLYDLDHSILHGKSISTSSGTEAMTPNSPDSTDGTPGAASAASSAAAIIDGKAMLFTTKTCPNCKMARSILDADQFSYETIDAEDNADLSRQFDIHQAPTLVVIKQGKVEKISTVSNIKKYVRG